MWYTSTPNAPEGRLLVHAWTMPLGPRGKQGFGKELKTNLVEIPREDSWPVCNHYRVGDVIRLLEEEHFQNRRPTPMRCPARGRITEFAVVTTRLNSLELEVKRCLGAGKRCTEPEWLGAMSKDLPQGSWRNTRLLAQEMCCTMEPEYDVKNSNEKWQDITDEDTGFALFD